MKAIQLENSLVFHSLIIADVFTSSFLPEKHHQWWKHGHETATCRSVAQSKVSMFHKQLKHVTCQYVYITFWEPEIKCVVL